MKKGPEFVFLFNPGLGPLWSIISQKIFGGRLSQGSELVLEVSEAYVENLELDGSLIVLAKNTIGSISKPQHQNEQPELEYNSRVGHVFMKNVRVMNEGIEWDHSENVYWKHEVHRTEYCEILLHGNSEFVASDVCIKGLHVFEVPDGYQLKLLPDSSNPDGFRKEFASLISDRTSWCWKYQWKGDEVSLVFLSNKSH